MPKEETAKKLIPHFESEAEEIEFWDEHDLEEFDWEPADDIVLAIKPERKQPVTFRLEPSVVTQLKEVAGRAGIGYQTLMRGLVKRGLDEMREGSKPGV